MPSFRGLDDPLAQFRGDPLDRFRGGFRPPPLQYRGLRLLELPQRLRALTAAKISNAKRSIRDVDPTFAPGSTALRDFHEEAVRQTQRIDCAVDGFH